MIWIGGNDLATNGKWVWTSRGRRIHPFVQWKQGSPSKSGHCLGIDVASYRWMDTNCERKAEFLCEQGIFFLCNFVHFSILYHHRFHGGKCGMARRNQFQRERVH